MFGVSSCEQEIWHKGERENGEAEQPPTLDVWSCGLDEGVWVPSLSGGGEQSGTEKGDRKRAPVYRLSLGPSQNYASERVQTGSEQVKFQFWTIPSDYI